MLRDDHGGFAVDRLEHSLQTATKAYKDNRDEEYVVCAFFTIWEIFLVHIITPK